MGADEAMDKFDELERWHKTIRNELDSRDVIEAIKARRSTADPEEDYHLALMLKFELLLEAIELQHEAEDVIDEMIEKLPDDVRFPIAKASLHLYNLNDAERALECIDQALVRARRTGRFRREALGVKARIHLRLTQYDKLSETLEEIMSFKTTRDIPDIPKERDFVDHAPPGAIPQDLLDRYNQFRPKRERD
jgi:tetratricopeptide (TPR) repeat protein